MTVTSGVTDGEHGVERLPSLTSYMQNLAPLTNILMIIIIRLVFSRLLLFTFFGVFVFLS